MVDFLIIATRPGKRGVIEIYPKFRIDKRNDLMTKGGDFYAMWDGERGLWLTDEADVIKTIDDELDKYAREYGDKFDSYRVLHMWDAETGMIDIWHKYCQKQLRDKFHMLDEKLIFSNTKPAKKDYSSKRLSYPLMAGDHKSYDKIISTLYSPEERHKIEWAIGAIVSGDSKKLQKFMVLYGAAGTGKSTILNIIQELFDGYYAVFDAKALGSANSTFALEAFKSNPLVAIQHDGDLSRIEDNTRLNSLVSHEIMTVNEKFKGLYSNRFKSFLFMGTNRPVKITDARSGLIRRLIDVTPTGNKIPIKEYRTLMKNVEFELGAIAQHCLDVYLEDPGYYDDYVPTKMMGASNDFYNFIIESYFTFSEENGTTLKQAWDMYTAFCEESKVNYPLTKRLFKEELRNYFWEYDDRITLEDGTRARNYFRGFRTDKFEVDKKGKVEETPEDESLINFNCTTSIFDELFATNKAQYANESGKPITFWDAVQTRLCDLDTSKVHYVMLDPTYIVIDFDLKDETGKKSFERNLKAASKWPATYAELSKSGAGIHLVYIYTGDPSKLKVIYDEDIEIKTFTGKSSLRRKLTKCNDIPIATISSGLPEKEEKVVNFEKLESENHLRALIRKALNREIHPNTKPSVDFICKILKEANASGLDYNVEDLYGPVLIFASQSTNQSLECLKNIKKAPFHSGEDPSGAVKDLPIAFYDIEVFPNLLLINYKLQGSENKVVRMINPTPEDCELLIRSFNLIGFNCRRYDNHIVYARSQGYSIPEIYKLSQNIINGVKGCFFGQAYNVSYTDVFDFSSKKQSLKKFEIELGITHKELGLPWDQPVPPERWFEVAEYCDNDVIATEAVFNDRKADFLARCILADVAGMTPNDTTNSLTTRIIFGQNRNPQDEFNYRNMGDTSKIVPFTEDGALLNSIDIEVDFEYTAFDKLGRPIFPGYIYDYGKSTYRGEEVGEGGYVYSEPGMYANVALLDIASMHPSSIVAENLFGNRYTKQFKEILDARLAIKHKDFEKARGLLGGKLAKYLDDSSQAKDLAQALKIAINSVYGLTSAKFDNPFRDVRNKDNIVAKRGALFMVNLKHEVQRRGYTVAHIKTDSIKIPNADDDIIKFVMDYGRLYGYNFEHEATYEKMCLVNDAVYIAKYLDNGEEHIMKLPTGEKVSTLWTATGTQFQVPYVFKTLFSKTPLVFKDFCETKAVSTSLYLDMNEGLVEGEHDYRFVGKVGSFCPIKPGGNGGLLMREKDGKYNAATGTKGYRWLEAETVSQLSLEDRIDKSYYEKLVDEAVIDISKYGDFEWFTADDFIYMNKPE